MENYDVVVIGGGHNGLVCAAYLLKAGYRVLVLEKRSVVGGAATTEEALPEEAPGFKFNLCAIDHEFIFLGPVLQELQLQQYGLEYLSCDPTVFCPHPDGKYFLAHKSLDKTCEHIAQYSSRDAQQYRQFIQYWTQITTALTPLFNAPPQAFLDIALNYRLDSLKKTMATVGSPLKALDFLRTMLSSPSEVLEGWFETEIVKAPLARLISEIGAPPSQKGTMSGAMMVAMRHNTGIARPKGGTGALVESLLKLIYSLGGVVLTEQQVRRVVVEKGRAVGVEIAEGKVYKAKKGVVSNIDAQRLFLQLVEPTDIDDIAPNLRHRLKTKITNNNETILKIDCALSEAPRFEGYNHQDKYLIGTVLIADSVYHVEKSHAMAAMGDIPDENPSMYLDVPSMLDPTLAPEGKHTLWIEFFAPYQIRGKEGTGLYGTGWTTELKNKVADRVIDKLAEYAPNINKAIIARRVESPAELGARLGAYKGNCYHLDMTLEQMMFLRPLPEIANYTTPIKGLYLTGAGTHPGGSISGMPGRNCARVFLRRERLGWG